VVELVCAGQVEDPCAHSPDCTAAAQGEPVPQELLDRVMQAHSLWTEQLRTERDER